MFLRYHESTYVATPTAFVGNESSRSIPPFSEVSVNHAIYVMLIERLIHFSINMTNRRKNARERRPQCFAC